MRMPAGPWAVAQPAPFVIPEDLRQLDFPALADRVQALGTPESEALLAACRGSLEAASCPPCAARQAAARLRLWLAHRAPCLR